MKLKKNKLISSLISERSTECTTKQTFSVRNRYKNSSEGNERENNLNTHCSNNGRISNDTNSDGIYEIYLDNETQNQSEIIT